MNEPRRIAPPNPDPLQRALHSLSGRLFLWLFGIVVIGFAAYAVVSMRTTSGHWRDLVYMGALRGSEIIRLSTRHAMLLNRKEDVEEIIKTIAGLPGVAGVRVYDKEGTIVVSADRAERGQRVDREAEACVICHDQESPLRSVSTEDRVRVYRAADGQRILGLITPIQNEPACLGCHVHRPDQTVLGVLDVKMSLAEADRHLAATQRQLVVATLLVALAIGAASAAFIYRVVGAPVRRLTAGAQRIASGDLGTTVPVTSRDEVGELASAFNRMTAHLRQAREEIAGWSQTLEQKVVEKTEELSRAQRHIVHMEKMASLGKLSATVAHELNNPLGGILTYAKLVEREIAGSPLGPAEREELSRYLSLIQKESGRCGNIVRNLLLFARRSEPRFAPLRINAIVERCLLLVDHAIRLAGIRLETVPLAGDDELFCDGDQIQQALVALLVNAIEAMPDGGSLAVRAEAVPGAGGEAVRIEVADTGPGIPPEILPHIFEPFFTTKEGGNGLGLGLAVVYGIVEAHGGRIEVSSRPGEGTSFEIVLPRKPRPATAARPAGAPGAPAADVTRRKGEGT